MNLARELRLERVELPSFAHALPMLVTALAFAALFYSPAITLVRDWWTITYGILYSKSQSERPR